MIVLLAATAAIQPVSATAEVTTSNGKHYRLETCFSDLSHLTTRFIYPDRTQLLKIDGANVTSAENDTAPEAGGDPERRFALGHNFLGIYFNLDRLLSTDGALLYGGSLKPVRSGKRLSGYRFSSPDTTPVDVTFTDWRGAPRVPHKVRLQHAGVTYRYRYTRIELSCGSA